MNKKQFVKNQIIKLGKVSQKTLGWDDSGYNEPGVSIRPWDGPRPEKR